MGGVSRRKTPLPPPPPETVAAFNDALGRALTLARERVAANPRDADAHYEVGAAMGLRASYTATVESSAMSAFKAAREAYDEHEKVLQIDTRRKDAGLIVGTYRYIVASLSMPLRWAAYMVGLRRRARTGTEARRGRGRVRRRQPGGSAIHAGRPLQPREAVRRGAGAPGDAARAIPAEPPRLARKRVHEPPRGQDRRRRTVSRRGHAPVRDRHAPAHVRRGRALVREARHGAREPGPQRAGPGRSREGADASKGATWLHGRAHFELGKLDLKDGKQAAANEHLRTAIRLCENDNDETTAARRAAAGPVAEALSWHRPGGPGCGSSSASSSASRCAASRSSAAGSTWCRSTSGLSWSGGRRPRNSSSGSASGSPASSR